MIDGCVFVLRLKTSQPKYQGLERREIVTSATIRSLHKEQRNLKVNLEIP